MALLKLSIQVGQSLRRFRKKYDAAGGPVEAVDQVELAFAIDFCQIQQGFIPRFILLNANAGRLVEGNELIIFIDDEIADALFHRCLLRVIQKTDYSTSS